MTAANTTPRKPRSALSPRHSRLLQALLAGQSTREQVDKVTGASNGPDEVLKMRRRFGLKLPCVRRAARDRDGHRVDIGVYGLDSTDRRKALELLQTESH